MSLIPINELIQVTWVLEFGKTRNILHISAADRHTDLQILLHSTNTRCIYTSLTEELSVP